MERACEKQHGGETNAGARHGKFPSKCRGAKTAGRKLPSRGQVISDQKILAALSSVFHTPQASGMPTKAQNSAALTSKPPLPMPNEPYCTAAALFALAAWSFATSASLMCHLGSTGLTRKLQIRPPTSI